MENILNKTIALVTSIPVIFAGWFGYVPSEKITVLEDKISQIERDVEEAQETFTLGAFNSSGGGTYRLKASVGLTDTTINLASFKEPVSNTPYTMSYLNTSIGYGTIEPQIPGRSEFISFTGITQNSDGSAQLTGVSRGLSRSVGNTGCIASTTLAVRHSGQSAFILSDSPCFFSEYAVKRNDESITGSWSFPTPTVASNAATKSWVEGIVNGGAVSTDSVIVAGTAGETITSGQILFYNKFEGEWRKADADLASTSRGVILGIAQGSGTDGVAISGGILLKGLDTKNSGAAPGTVLYVSNTAGATSTTAGTIDVAIGVSRNSSGIYFDPSFVAANVEIGSTGKISDDFISTSTILSTNIFGAGTDGDVTISANSTTTLTRDMYYDDLTINGSIMSNGWRIFVKNTISGTGNITATGTPGASCSGTAIGALGGATTTGFFRNGGGGAGGNSVTAASGQAGTSTQALLSPLTFSLTRSGAGGTGGTQGNSGGTGGAAGASLGTTTRYTTDDLYSILSGISYSTTTSQVHRILPGPGGAGGGSGGSSSGGSGCGGGGGATGNVAMVVARIFSGSFSINVSGGAGGQGADQFSGTAAGGGGGGGGKGGTGIRIYDTDTWSGTCIASGGAGGGAGGGGSVAATAGTAGDSGYCMSIDVTNLVR